VVAGFCLFVRVDLHASAAENVLPGWYRWALLVLVSGLIFAAVPQWLIPATTITPDGIRRHFAGDRRVAWDDIADFTVTRSFGVRRVYAHLVNGGRRRLDGVPPKALLALRDHVGSGATTGTWWLVDYSVMQLPGDRLGPVGSAGSRVSE
jgi:hypothetical protein